MNWKFDCLKDRFVSIRCNFFAHHSDDDNLDGIEGIDLPSRPTRETCWATVADGCCREYVVVLVCS